ncbi:MAG: methylmalonyl Co-A mutase-associated GTPase MeaB [Anaerolineales bacterium]
MKSVPDLAERVRAGDRRALARLLSLIESDDDAGGTELARLFPHRGQAHVIGVTGAPGTGKSTLVNRLALTLRSQGSPEVAVLAVDPSSPFTGGAILGDRIRMREASVDRGVFIRSMATRGALGGLALRTQEAVEALDAAGFGHILVETVGAGQAEVEVAQLAATTIVVEAPGFGDDVQAIKAGILEIADILVVNKADLPGADETVRALRAALDLGRPSRRGTGTVRRETSWEVPILRTIATRDEGVLELAGAIAAHRQHLESSDEAADRQRLRAGHDLALRLQEELAARFLKRLGDPAWNEAIEKVASREVSPRAAVKELLERGTE